MPAKIAFWFICLLPLSACSGTKISTPSTENMVAPVQDSLHDTTALQWWQNKNCPRGVPEATFGAQNPNFTSKTFELSREGGVETASLFNGDSLMLSSTGCDYYILTYTFKSYNPEAAKGDMAYWYSRAADLLLGLQDSKTPFDYRELSEKFRAVKQPQAGQEIETDTGNKGRSIAKIVETGRLPQGKGGYMILRLSIGPL